MRRDIICNPSLYLHGLCSADCFAELLLDKLPTNQIQAWIGTNRGAFVVCRYEFMCCNVYCMWSHDILFYSLLRSKLPGVRERISQMVQPVVSSLRTDPLKGQQALLSELDR